MGTVASIIGGISAVIAFVGMAYKAYCCYCVKRDSPGSPKQAAAAAADNSTRCPRSICPLGGGNGSCSQLLSCHDDVLEVQSVHVNRVFMHSMNFMSSDFPIFDFYCESSKLSRSNFTHRSAFKAKALIFVAQGTPKGVV